MFVRKLKCDFCLGPAIYFYYFGGGTDRAAIHNQVFDFVPHLDIYTITYAHLNHMNGFQQRLKLRSVERYLSCTHVCAETRET
jgi:hypothetical protein